jgi:hypothetical protein
MSSKSKRAGTGQGDRSGESPTPTIEHSLDEWKELVGELE